MKANKTDNFYCLIVFCHQLLTCRFLLWLAMPTKKHTIIRPDINDKFQLK